MQAFEQPPSSLQIARQIVLPQLRRVRGDAMIRFAYGTVDSNDNVIAPAAPGPDLRALIFGGELRNQRIFGVRHDDQVLRRHFSRAAVTASTAAAAAAAAGGSSTRSTNSATVQRISSDALWQHLQYNAPGSHEAKERRLIAVLQAAQLRQFVTDEHGTCTTLQHASLFIVVAQVLGTVVPHKWTLSEKYRNPFEPFIVGNSVTGRHAVLQLAQKVFAACLAELAGAIIDTEESDTTNSSIDSYVQSVLQAYAVDDIVELIDSLWSGTRDVHPILVGLLPRLLPINVQVC
jgi:hypothetical protein